MTLVWIHLFQGDFPLTLFSAPTLVVCLSVQTLDCERCKLDLQEVTPNLNLGAARDYREGSVSRADRRRRNYVRDHCGYFDYRLVAWAFRISRIHRFIPRLACDRPGSTRFAFRVREKGLRLIGRFRTLGALSGVSRSLADHLHVVCVDSHNSALG
jgi:hypothetical protein